MNSHKADIAKNCLKAVYDNTHTFPEIIHILLKSGFEGYTVDYRRNTTTYFHEDGESIVFDNPPSEIHIAPQFNQNGIKAQIKWAQSGSPDYSYVGFCEKVKREGCAGYIVSFPGRRVLYFGKTAEAYTEHFPQ